MKSMQKIIVKRSLFNAYPNLKDDIDMIGFLGSTDKIPEERPSAESSKFFSFTNINSDKNNSYTNSQRIIDGIKTQFHFGMQEEIHNFENFCVGFFAAGLVQNSKPQILSNSEGNKSACEIGRASCRERV